MTYSYTQINQYLSCPRRYKHRYLDGWKEKDTRAAMMFGRAFEQAVAAYFQRQDAAAVLYREWALTGTTVFTIPSGTAGTACCNREYSCSIASPRTIGFVSASLGAIYRSSSPSPWRGRTTSWPTWMPSESSTAPAACWSGKPLPAAIRRSRQDCSLSIRSWFAIPGSPVSQTWLRWCLSASDWSRFSTFRTIISDEQRDEFGHLVQDSIRRIEAAEFLPHSGIRFPQNPCTSCPYIGLCLGRSDLTESALVRRPGADDLGWLDELAY